jgi:hypothetical protein
VAIVAHDISKLAVVFNDWLFINNPYKANLQAWWASVINNRNDLGHFENCIGHFITHLLVSSGKGFGKS